MIMIMNNIFKKRRCVILSCTAVLFLSWVWIMVEWYRRYQPFYGSSSPEARVSDSLNYSTTLKTNQECLILPRPINDGHHNWSIKPRKTILNSRFTSRGVISVYKTRFVTNVEGDLLHLILYTHDISGNQRTRGGDFFQATLSDSKKERWTAGKVVDYDNGTYSIYFYVGWGGNVYINVTLVNPREDVKWIKNVHRPLEGKAIIYGIFEDAKKIRSKRSGLCTVYSEGNWKNKCEYRNENSFGKSVLICDKPRHFMCEDLKFFTGTLQPKNKQNSTKIQTYSSIAENNLYKFGEIQKNKFRFKQLQSVKGANINDESSKLKRPTSSLYTVPLFENIFVQLKKDTRLKTEAAECLPECGPGLAETISDGYWSNGTWNSMVCNSKQWRTRKEIVLCLKDKGVYFIGDSTLRQWYEELVKYFGYMENEDEIRNKLYRNYSNKLFNFGATFYFHFWAFSTWPYSVEKVKFMADFVDSLSDTKCNYILFLTASFHYVDWTRESYGEMLEKTKGAIDRLFDRCPKSTVIIKGSHTVTVESDRMAKNWILYDMNLHLRQIFTKDPRIIFIDVWDMDLSFPCNKTIHMPSLVIIQELLFAFSHICPAALQKNT